MNRDVEKRYLTYMTQRPIKRSLTLKGHRTSVSLETPFWESFKAIAAKEGKAINQLAAEIDAHRAMQTGLASAIRLYILAHYKSMSDA